MNKIKARNVMKKVELKKVNPLSVSDSFYSNIVSSGGAFGLSSADVHKQNWKANKDKRENKGLSGIVEGEKRK